MEFILDPIWVDVGLTELPELTGRVLSDHGAFPALPQELKGSVKRLAGL